MEKALLERMFRLQRLLGRYYHQKMKKYGPLGNIHRGQGRILAVLKLQPEMSQKDLSNILDMRPQSLGQLLEKLESAGYVSRSQSEQDLRVMKVRLTEAGRELLQKGEQEPADGTGLFAGFSKQEQEQLSSYLDRITETLAGEIGEAGLEHGCSRERHPHAHHHHRHPRHRSGPKGHERQPDEEGC